MTGEFLKRDFFQSEDGLVSKFLQKWPNGSLAAAARDYQIRTVIAAQSRAILGIVTTIKTSDGEGVPTYVIHRVQRENGAADVGKGEGVGTFLAFQAALAMVTWASEVDKLVTFNLAIQAPVGYDWQRFCGLMGMNGEILVPMSGVGSNIEMPGRRYN